MWLYGKYDSVLYYFFYVSMLIHYINIWKKFKCKVCIHTHTESTRNTFLQYLNM